MQKEVENLVDAVSSHIGNFEVAAVNGERNDMLLQKQIVSSTQLLEKVNTLRDRIDAGDFDDQSNIGSILNTQLDADEQRTLVEWLEEQLHRGRSGGVS